MKVFPVLVFALCLGHVFSIAPEDECRVRRVKRYDEDRVVLEDEEDDRIFWAKEGYDVGGNDANWFLFQSYGQDLICLDRSKAKPRCVPYQDPEHKYVQNGILRHHTTAMCAACAPGSEGSYGTGSCDCEAGQFCERQYRTSIRESQNGTTGGQDEWSEDHGVCRDIPDGKIGATCSPSLTNAINDINDQAALDPDNRFWCGDIRGWEGACYHNECHMCTPPYKYEETSETAMCKSSKGEVRWCDNSGNLLSVEPPSNSFMRDTSMTVFLAIIMVATVTSCIIGCIMCKKGGTSV